MSYEKGEIVKDLMSAHGRGLDLMRATSARHQHTGQARQASALQCAVQRHQAHLDHKAQHGDVKIKFKRIIGEEGAM